MAMRERGEGPAQVCVSMAQQWSEELAGAAQPWGRDWRV